jgi:hypothetical protein
VTKFTAGGVYDAEEQENAVDKSASFDPAHSTGEGENKALILNVGDFRRWSLRLSPTGRVGWWTLTAGLSRQEPRPNHSPHCSVKKPCFSALSTIYEAIM